MMSTKTLTVPMLPSGGSCNGNPPVQLTVLCPTETSNIVGWRKRTLYLLLILLVSVVLINMTLILWIIKILDFSSEGAGRLRITEKGFRIESDVEFLDTLSGKQILSLPSHPLKVESARNVTFKAMSNRGYVTNLLQIGESGFHAVGNYFIVRGTSDKILLQVDPHEVIVSANHMVVSESGGLRLDGTLETPLVRGEPNKDLKLESLLKKVRIRSEGAMQVDSPAGGIAITGLRDMNLKSTGGKVVIDSSRLEAKKLKISRNSGKDKKNHQEVFQVCMCNNGRLFLAHRKGYCQIEGSYCEDTAQGLYRMRDMQYIGS